MFFHWLNFRPHWYFSRSTKRADRRQTWHTVLSASGLVFTHSLEAYLALKFNSVCLLDKSSEREPWRKNILFLSKILKPKPFSIYIILYIYIYCIIYFIYVTSYKVQTFSALLTVWAGGKLIQRKGTQAGNIRPSRETETEIKRV